MKHLKPLILESNADFKISDKDSDVRNTSEDQLTVYKVTAQDPNGTLKALIEYIGKVGNEGHSFKIVVDPNSKEDRKEFHWKGEEDDKFKEIEIESEPKKVKKGVEEVPTDKEESEEKTDKVEKSEEKPETTESSEEKTEEKE